ncbi:hypothetical protein OROMI_010481 [Orobanche minor]
MRMFKWDPFFDFKQEPALVPIWVKIMALPLQWFDQGALQTIGALMGTFLKADPMTINRSRLDHARICVEINLKNTLPNSVGISCGTFFNEFVVEYEKLPSFCHHCNHIGHSIDACDMSEDEVIVVDNRFASLESMGAEEFCPPPSGSGVKSSGKGSQAKDHGGKSSPFSQGACKNKGSVNPEPEVNIFSQIPPHIPPPHVPPFVLSDCNLSGAGGVPLLFNLRSSGGDEKGSSSSETHRGSHQDNLKNPDDLVLSSSDDDIEQTDAWVHQDGALSDPSYNSSSNFSKAVGDPPDSGQSSPSHTLVIALPKISDSSSKEGSAGKNGKKGKNKKIPDQDVTSKNRASVRNRKK